MTSRDVDIIREIILCGEARTSVLARRLCMSRATMSRALEGLRKRGILFRTQGEAQYRAAEDCAACILTVCAREARLLFVRGDGSCIDKRVFEYISDFTLSENAEYACREMKAYAEVVRHEYNHMASCVLLDLCERDKRLLYADFAKDLLQLDARLLVAAEAERQFGEGVVLCADCIAEECYFALGGKVGGGDVELFEALEALRRMISPVGVAVLSDVRTEDEKVDVEEYFGYTEEDELFESITEPCEVERIEARVCEYCRENGLAFRELSGKTHVGHELTYAEMEAAVYLLSTM